jgi:HK97 family phage portal protein
VAHQTRDETDFRAQLLNPYEGGGWGGSVGRAFYGTEVTSLQDIGKLFQQMNMGGDDSMSVPYRQSWLINACVNVRANFVSQVPYKLWASTDEDAEAIDSGELFDLFESPNASMTWASLMRQTQVALDLDGECVWLLSRDQVTQSGSREWQPINEGQLPREIMPVRGSKIRPNFSTRTGLAESWTYTGPSGAPVTYPAHAVVQFHHPDSEDWRRGFGWVNAATRAAERQFQIERYDDALLKRGGIPGVALQTKEHLTATQAKQSQERIEERLSGSENAFKPIVLGAGLTPVQLGMSPADMQHQELRIYDRDTIMALAGVTKPLLSITDDVNRANSQEAYAVFVEQTGMSMLRLIEDVIQSRFLRRLNGPESEWAFSFDTDSLEALQESLDAKVERATKLVQVANVPFQTAAQLADWEIQEDVFADEAGGNVAEQSSAAPEQTLNGAQIKSMLEIILQVAQGVLPKEAAVQILVAAFPFDEARARKILSTIVEGSVEPPPAPGAPPPNAPEPPAPDEPDDDEPEPRSTPNHRSVLNSRADRQALLDTLRGIKAPHEQSIHKKSKRALRDYVGAYRKRLQEVRSNERTFNVPMKRLDESQLLTELASLAPLIEDFYPDLAESLKADYARLFEKSAKQLAREIGAGVATTPGLADWTSVLLTKRIELAEGALTTLSTEVTESIARVLLDGETFTTGTLQDAILAKFDEVDDQIKIMRDRLPERAQRIARTEAAAVSNIAREAEMTANGVTRRVWISELDAGSREDHAALDGQTRLRGESFKEGVELKYPLDPAAPASEVVNCGCSIAAAISDDIDEALGDLFA